MLSVYLICCRRCVSSGRQVRLLGEDGTAVTLNGPYNAAPAAGKSGTSQDSRDAVFAGFTSDMTATVWVGNDDGTPMKGVTGGGLPARIWSDFMLEAHAGSPVRPLLADASLYANSAGEPASISQPVEPQPEKPKKKKSFFKRLFGGS